MITTTSELSSQFESTPGARLRERAADDAAEAGERRADEERDRERALDVDAERAHHRAVVDAGADHHAGARLLQPEPEPDADHEREQQDQQALLGVLDALDVQVHEVVDPAGPGDALGDAAEVVEHLVGEDDRDRDRDQRLAQVLALVPAQQELLHDDADDADEQRADDERHDPVDDADLRAREPERAALADEVRAAA